MDTAITQLYESIFNLIPSSVPRKQKVINPRDIAAIDGDIVVFGSNSSIIANVSTDAMGIVDDAHVEQKDDALMQIGEFELLVRAMMMTMSMMMTMLMLMEE